MFDGHAAHIDTAPVVEWFNRGGSIDLSDTSPAADLLAMVDANRRIRQSPRRPRDGRSRTPEPGRAAIADFVLEGPLRAQEDQPDRRRHGILGTPGQARPRPEPQSLEQLMEDDEPAVKGKKKYYN